MVRLLIGLGFVGALAASSADAREIGNRHQLEWELDLGYTSLDTALGAWPEGGAGKLRFEHTDDGLADPRLLLDYRGRITDTLWVSAALEAADGINTDLGLTEAHIDWRPVPRSANQFRFRFGAFYPPFSLENGDIAWTSPFTTSFSAINAWLAEEIRPVGAEMRLNRTVGHSGSPHEISFFAAGFYGNDPAGTLLFWRGFALHDRQTRLNERIALPSLPIFDSNGNVAGSIDRSLDPISEIDHKPGFYAGVEWTLKRRATVQLARYDNRADPWSFSDGQWGWDTRFWHLSAQVELPADLGLVSQWMSGRTGWLIAVTPQGTMTPATAFVDDAYDSHFLMLTKRIGDVHRVSLRHDVFDFRRPNGLNIDSGNATTLGYEYRAGPRLTLAAEWLRIESSRDIWPLFYGLPDRHKEEQLQVQVRVSL